MLVAILLIQAVLIGLLLAVVAVLAAKLSRKRLDHEGTRLLLQQQAQTQQADILLAAVCQLADRGHFVQFPPATCSDQI